MMGVAPPAGQTSDRARPVLVWSHGRSGSTLLLDTLGSDPAFWPIYEPLQEVRQQPPPHFNIPPEQISRCHDTLGANNALVSVCPMRDATLVLSALECNFLPLLATWYGHLDLTHRKAAWMLHGTVPGAGFTTTQYTPDLEVRRVAKLVEQERRCRAHTSTVAKVIRLNGELCAMHNISLALGKAPPLVLHLVRDPRAIYASRKRLSGAGAHFGVPATWKKSSRWGEMTHAQRAAIVGEWARSVCGATRRDAAIGLHQLGDTYELVEYSEFTRRPREVIERLYARHFERPVPAAVYEYIRQHVQRAGASASEGTAAVPPSPNVSSWQYMFSTAPRDVDRVEKQWRDELTSWEVRIIDAECSGTPAHSYTGPLKLRKERMKRSAR